MFCVVLGVGFLLSVGFWFLFWSTLAKLEEVTAAANHKAIKVREDKGAGAV